MILEELTTPTVAKLPIREFGAHLKLGSGFSDDGSEDVVLEICLRSAMAAIEARIGKALIRRSFSWQITRWFEQDAQALPIAPVAEITSITLVSDAGSEVIDPARYGLEKDSQRPKLTARGNLPNIPEGGYGAIVFDAGFGPWASIPADLRQAMLMLAASFYENRTGEARINGMPYGVAALIEGYRPVRIGGAR
ncbi:MAG: head-tail connector protein [Paracoccaceae bacterium]